MIVGPEDSPFFVLSSLDSDAHIRVNESGVDDSFAGAEWSEKTLDFLDVKCARYPEHFHLSMRLNRPLAAVLTEGRVGNVSWVNYGDLLIDRHTLDVLENARATGYTAEPVVVNQGQWFLLRALGWGGMAASDSKIYRADYCEICKYVNYKVRALPTCLVDVNQWDRSDMFMVWPLSKFIVVTRRIAKELSRAGITGLACVPEIAILRRSDTYGPGRLSNYMDLDLAIARGNVSHIDEV
jgi:hypothetical protein